jgi:hypothetical protein
MRKPTRIQQALLDGKWVVVTKRYGEWVAAFDTVREATDAILVGKMTSVQMFSPTPEVQAVVRKSLEES